MHFRRVPDKRELDLVNREFVGLDQGQQGLDRMLIDRIALYRNGLLPPVSDDPGFVNPAEKAFPLRPGARYTGRPRYLHRTVAENKPDSAILAAAFHAVAETCTAPGTHIIEAVIRSAAFIRSQPCLWVLTPSAIPNPAPPEAPRPGARPWIHAPCVRLCARTTRAPRLANHSGAGSHREPANPRFAAFLRLEGAGLGRGLARDREVARTQGGRDDGALRAPDSRRREGRGGTGGREHRGPHRAERR